MNKEKWELGQKQIIDRAKIEIHDSALKREMDKKIAETRKIEKAQFKAEHPSYDSESFGLEEKERLA